MWLLLTRYLIFQLELRDIVLEEPFHRLRVVRAAVSKNVIHIDSDDNEDDGILDTTPSSMLLYYIEYHITTF